MSLTDGTMRLVIRGVMRGCELRIFMINKTSRGLGQSLQQVVLGRVLAGVGGAGKHCLVSIVIARQSQDALDSPAGLTSGDLVPIREFASRRSCANIAATAGRSLGGPIVT